MSNTKQVASHDNGNPGKSEGVCPLILQPARQKTPWINLSKLLDSSPCTNNILTKTREIDTGSISLPKFQLSSLDVKQSVKNRMLKQGVACCRSSQHMAYRQ